MASPSVVVFGTCHPCSADIQSVGVLSVGVSSVGVSSVGKSTGGVAGTYRGVKQLGGSAASATRLPMAIHKAMIRHTIRAE